MNKWRTSAFQSANSHTAVRLATDRSVCSSMKSRRRPRDLKQRLRDCRTHNWTLHIGLQGGLFVRSFITCHSHLNAYVRFKLALTEDNPTIKPYAEDRWADLSDTQSTPIEVSLTLLESLHDRWVRLLRSLTPEQWKRTFRHPELGEMTLEKTVAMYAWHGKHHVAHITELQKRMSW